jgi:transcription elongation factor Elf1
MSGVILLGKALKIVNKGGGRVTKTTMETFKDQLGKEFKKHRHYQSRERVKGSDYIVFNCPGCGQRNKQCAYQVKGRSGNSLSFRCNKCQREIEVAAPSMPVTIAMDAALPRQPVQLVGPSGQPI